MLFRLARLWGWPRPSELAAVMDPGDLDAWLAYDIVEPFGNEWDMAGTIAAEVANQMQAYVAAKSGRRLSQSELARPRDYVPRPVWFTDEKDSCALSADESERQMQGLI